jgi:hypothetical protein
MMRTYSTSIKDYVAVWERYPDPNYRNEILIYDAEGHMSYHIYSPFDCSDFAFNEHHLFLFVEEDSDSPAELRMFSL